MKDLLTLVLEQASDKFKTDRETIVHNKRPQLVQIGEFTRPAVHVHDEMFDETKDFIVSDMTHIQSDWNMFFKQNTGLLIMTTKKYLHLATPNGTKEECTTDDIGIISFMPEKFKIIPFEEALATAYALIQLDLKGTGPLYEADPEKDKNMNLGYCELLDIGSTTDKKCVELLFLERVVQSSWVNGKRTYHIHSDLAPRFYKPNRHLLV